MIYLDSSALVKLAVTEPESAALTEWLGHSANVIRVSSPIVRVEVPRAVWRSDPGSLPQAYTVVRRVRDIRLTASVLTRAAGARPMTLRALDAIHLASALTIRHDLTAFVSYDKRLLAAARGSRPRHGQPGLTAASIPHGREHFLSERAAVHHNSQCGAGTPTASAARPRPLARGHQPHKYLASPTGRPTRGPGPRLRGDSDVGSVLSASWRPRRP